MGHRRIYIEFTRPKGFFPVISWLIRLFQKTEYSHVRLCWAGFRGQVPVIYEASGAGLKFIGPIGALRKPVHVVSRFPLDLTGEQYRELVRLCMSYAGIKYGHLQILGIALVCLFGLKKNPFADGKKSQVCSEIVGYLLADILGWKTGLDLDIAGPREIHEFLDMRFPYA
jgi:hypothetical protein